MKKVLTTLACAQAGFADGGGGDRVAVSPVMIMSCPYDVSTTRDDICRVPLL